MIIEQYTKDFDKLTNEEISKYSLNYKMLKTTMLEDLISEMTIRNINTESITSIKEEIEWRQLVREEVLSQEIPIKSTWGFFPTMNYKTNWKLTTNQLHHIGMYVIFIMFWDIGNGIGFKDGFIIQRPDGNDEKSNAKIKLGRDKFGNLIIKCVASGDLIFDNERNIRSLTLFLKAFELIAKREGIIK